jgi:hypothetical protein
MNRSPTRCVARCTSSEPHTGCRTRSQMRRGIGRPYSSQSAPVRSCKRTIPPTLAARARRRSTVRVAPCARPAVFVHRWWVLHICSSAPGLFSALPSLASARPDSGSERTIGPVFDRSRPYSGRAMGRSRWAGRGLAASDAVWPLLRAAGEVTIAAEPSPSAAASTRGSGEVACCGQNS